MKILRKIFGIIFFGCILLCWSGLSFGADWTLYYESGVEMRYYDKASIERPQKDLVRVALKTVALGAQEGEITYIEMNCTTHKFRDLSGTVDKITGRFVSDGQNEGHPWTWIPHESTMGVVYETLCGNWREKKGLQR